MRFWGIIGLFLLTMHTACLKVDTAVSDLPNCEDGLLNNNEREIDCGGPNCSPCPARMTALVNGDAWKLTGANITSQINGSSIYLSGMDSAFRTISLIHSGSFAPGTYPLLNGLYSTPLQTFLANEGSLHITEWDTVERFISGYFSFKGFSGPTDSVLVTAGYFSFSPY